MKNEEGFSKPFSPCRKPKQKQFSFVVYASARRPEFFQKSPAGFDNGAPSAIMGFLIFRHSPFEMVRRLFPPELLPLASFFPSIPTFQGYPRHPFPIKFEVLRRPRGMVVLPQRPLPLRTKVLFSFTYANRLDEISVKIISMQSPYKLPP